MGILEIKEYIQFGGFDSKSLNLYLIERNAPAPAEKERIVNNPNRDGDTDFSIMQGEKKFESRPITYVFQAFMMDYPNRKVLERKIKGLTTTQLPTDLFDTHDDGFHWVGKCISVDVVDDAEKRTLIATLQFRCYPYLLSNRLYFDDVIKNHSIHDTLAWTKFAIDGSKDVVVYNSGEHRVDVDIIVEALTPIVETETGESSTEEVQVITTQAKTYNVKNGDTLWGIANTYGVTVNDLKKWNGITGDWTYPGVVLIVKPAETVTKVIQTDGGTTVKRTYFMKLIEEDGTVHYLNNGINYSQNIMLFVGENKFKVEGKGTISFHSRAEVMA